MSHDIYLMPPSIPCKKCGDNFSIAKLGEVIYPYDIICDNCGETNKSEDYGKYLGVIKDVGKDNASTKEKI